MAILPGTKESYIGALLENIIYGLYLSVFLEFCTLFYKSKIRSGVHTYLLITSGLMFILITMRCIIDTYRCIAAFDNALDFGPPNSPLGILTNSCWLMVFSIADVFIIFRTFVVWDRRWLIIALPSMLCLANFIISVLSIVSYGELDRSNPGIWASVDWLTIVISLTLSTNVICTWSHFVPDHADPPSGCLYDRQYSSFPAIYTAVLVATMVVIRSQSFVFFVFIDCLSPLIGLVFSYIIIRVSRGTSYGESTMNTTSISHLHYRGNNQDFESGPTISARSGGKTEVQIRLEQTTYGSAEVDSVKPEDASPNNIGKYTA
ncbi:hypothetical protein MSAN_00827200 [Mycena sanguinolenta]|uniref:Uncharacterized protein n=1 Tax=Mycena sanguinolenta TaxID=230812 RepID=A0A8H6YZH9_9AGAR|nr:hypothetical protein MSAN_00827200 [Mycena sanguinolenta]